jgi:hypothetical protein
MGAKPTKGEGGSPEPERCGVRQFHTTLWEEKQNSYFSEQSQFCFVIASTWEGQPAGPDGRVVLGV